MLYVYVKHVVILCLFSSICHGQLMEVIDPVTQQVTMVRHGSMNMPHSTALEVINECNKRIDENPQDWQAYYLRSMSKQILYKFKASIEDTKVLIENRQLLDLAYWTQGESYIYMLDYSNAIKAYKKALIYYDETYVQARINYIIGMCYIQLENEEEACAYFEKMGDLRSHSGFKRAKNYCLK